MAEEVTTPPVETPPATSETYINPDGTYKEGWKEALLPEELRNEQFFDSPFNANVRELLKTAGNQAKMLGKKGVIPIDAKSTEFEVQAWRRAVGVPDKYVYQKPADLKSVNVPDEFVNQTLDGFNKMNMTQAQVDFAMGQFANFWKATEAEFEKTEADEVNKVNQEILAEENTEYETNSHYIDNAVRRFTEGWPEEEILKLFSPVDYKGGMNSKDNIELKKPLRKFMISVGKAMGEGRLVQGDTGGKSLQEQLDEVMKHPDYNHKDVNVRKPYVEKALKLREQLNKQLGRV